MLAPLRARLRAAPRPYAADKADWALEALAETPAAALAQDPAARPFLHGVAGCSPYLARLMRVEAAALPGLFEAAPETAMNDILARLTAEAAEAPDMAAVMAALRRGKRQAALLIALADVGEAWDLQATTGALTDLADAALAASVDWLLRREVQRGKLPLDLEAPAADSGYAVIAMGKHGARELNYSSDIDLVVFFDPDRFEAADYAQVKDRLNRVTRDLVKLMQESTADGYVFRTDLRLRPDPGATPPCMDMDAAERYYESLGKNWERAAYIKARPAAGDLSAGAAFLDRLQPFVWRKYLDYAAIEDVWRMKSLIHAHKGHEKIRVVGHDMKLGRGGIREIEFFAQTQQMIAGGRNRALREPTTLGALAALAQAGTISAEARDEMGEDYIAFRQIEHRIQMIDDAQTHQIPASKEGADRLAAFLGYSSLDAFSDDLTPRMQRVSRRFERLFQPAEVLAEAGGAEIALDGPEGDPGSLAALGDLGYADPKAALSIVRGWSLGRVAAARSERAREKLIRLAPVILRRCADGGAPDVALAQFDRFVAGLPAGVQVFSLLESNPKLLELLAEIFAAAPRMATYLSRNAAVMDAMLSGDFFEPLPDLETLKAELDRILQAQGDYESILDAARRWAKERMFQQSVLLLRGLADARAAGRGFSDVAAASVAQVAVHAGDDFARRHGRPPGAGVTVAAMGRLGAEEMTAGSDLDLILIYDADESEESDGPKPLGPARYYTRFTQKLIAALTVPTAEGAVYEVDMRLRPSGRAGPLATALSAFQRYQREDAWTWEHMALTRARVVAGEPALAARVTEALATALVEAGARAEPGAIRRAAAEMRQRLDEAHAESLDNPWRLKHARGALVDIEFIAQTGVLEQGLAAQGLGHTGDALAALAEAGALSAEEAQALIEAHERQSALLQLERAALSEPFDPETAAPALRAAVARILGAERFEEAEARLRALQAGAQAVSKRWFA